MSYYYNPINDLMYKSFTNYFNNPLLTKVNTNLYAVKIKCHLIGVYRYLLVIVSNDSHQIGSTNFLNNLYWDNLQTRTFSTDPYNLNTHQYIPDNTDPMNQKIVNISHKNTSTYMFYNATLFPINITLLFTSKNTSYNKNGTLCAAIETYETSISIY